MRRTAVAVLVGTGLMMPTAAQATFLPGTEPPVEWRCTAQTGRVTVDGPCTENLQRSIGARTDLVGAAVVTTKGAELRTSSGAVGGTSTASVASTQILNGLLKVTVEGARATETAGCGPSGPVFTGSVHIDKLTVNGVVYTDLDGPRTIRTPFGTVEVGVSHRDWIDSSFDANEGEYHAAVQVSSMGQQVVVGAAAVWLTGFPC